MAGNFEDKYKVKIVKHADYYSCSFIVDGNSYYITFGAGEDVSKRIQLEIRRVSGKSDSGTTIGRPKGSKNYAGRNYNEKDLKRIFNNIHAAAVGTTILTKSVTIDGVAGDLLKREVASAQFYDYTGNLTASYQAHIIDNRKIVRTIYFRKLVKGYKFGKIRRTKKGARFVERRDSPYHKSGLSATRSINAKTRKKLYKNIRFLKDWEYEKGGYSSDYGPRRWSVNIRRGVLITNSAPYSSAVERANYTKRVLRNATAQNAVAGKWSKKAKMLGRFAANAVFKKTFGKNFSY
jgi:hypothetical protein